MDDMNDITTVSLKKRLYTTIELKKMGLSYYRINKLVSENKLVKLSSSVYENVNYHGEESDFYYASAFVPKGVICLMSAATYYNLTTYRMDSVNVAIKRDCKVVTLPDWPQLSIYSFSKERFSVGIDEVNEDDNVFRIYDIEKTVVDIILYRNKVGIEETKEILISYLSRKDKNMVKLHQYAKMFHCDRILSTYLEVLL